MARYYIGTSGWHYDDWRGIFYPKKLPKTKWLEFFAQHFITLELNNPFYHLPTENAFNKWYKETPKDFLFAVKASRFITHIKRLRECEESVTRFIERAALLKEKLGPILFQLPPGLHRDDERLADFLAMLPIGNRYAIEFRHESWFEEEVYKLLRKYNAGFCVFDMPKMISPIVTTTNFGYVRFHGSGSLYSSSYTEKEMQAWAKKITKMARNLDAVYIYFNNDVSGYALKNADTIHKYLE